ncbi:hypothetical protein F8M41_016625 [Gigaspora margarita]|uniref:Uncharacterized protein n=1 Tax=Gigaspora margarita TaxID=4874 RepID=A0A8H3WV47_GIGMA|nr:hypothetical protein F8M41_016625 [Gigaspora margarita]
MTTKAKRYNLRNKSPTNLVSEEPTTLEPTIQEELTILEEPTTQEPTTQEPTTQEEPTMQELQLVFDKIDELNAVGFQIQKQTIPRNKKQLTNEMWKEDLSASQLAFFNKIWDKIKAEENVKKVNWNDIKKDYNEAKDKSSFIKNFHNEWFGGRDRTVAKKLNCELDNVILKRTQLLLLLSYLLNINDHNVSVLKYYLCVYERFSELHEIIGENILLLPLPTSFFTAHDNGKKVLSLISWFRTAKENSINMKKQCLFCNEIHSNTLPPHMRHLSSSSSIVDQFEICRLHNAELHIVPDGLIVSGNRI